MEGEREEGEGGLEKRGREGRRKGGKEEGEKEGRKGSMMTTLQLLSYTNKCKAISSMSWVQIPPEQLFFHSEKRHRRIGSITTH